MWSFFLGFGVLVGVGVGVGVGVALCEFNSWYKVVDKERLIGIRLLLRYKT